MVAPGARGCESWQGDAEGMTARGPGMAAGGIRGDGRAGSDGTRLPPPQAVDVGLPLLRFPLSLLPAAIPECGPSNASPRKRTPCKDCGVSSTPPNHHPKPLSKPMAPKSPPPQQGTPDPSLHLHHPNPWPKPQFYNPGQSPQSLSQPVTPIP